MKIRNISILFTAMICIIVAITIFFFNKNISDKKNMVDYNERLNGVISAISSDQNTDDIQTKYGCTIIFHDNDMYESLLMSAIAEESIILDYEKDGKIIAKVVFAGNANHYKEVRHKTMITVIGILGGVLVTGYIILAVLYYQYERPFRKLKNFAQNVAQGNLNIPLKMEKSNYFGVFTESFDLMRAELKTAKENEYKANASKKELVAELSHDMKTPIATMKATCEVMITSLEMNRQVEPLYYQNKLAVIIKKADMLDQLIDNMFHATLEELQALKVNAAEQPSIVVKEIFNDQQDFIGINITNEIPELLIYIDTLRFRQVVDNIVNNANKYAGTDLWISYMEKDNGLLITIRDNGPGVDNEEIMLITQKFYKGRNGEKQNGAGLGLYLADYFMRQMGGSFSCYNDNGFVIELFLRKV